MARKVQAVKQSGAAYLKNHGVVNSAAEASQILSSLLNVSEQSLFFASDSLSDSVYEEFFQRLTRRIAGEPLQQVIGYVDFLDCRIKINRSVLIPRQETEILADLVVRRLRPLSLEGKTLLDLCTGSGCLAIAIKKKLPEVRVVAADISLEALDMARMNAEENGVRIDFFQGDFFEPLRGEKFDFVVSNPPYISKLDYQELDAQVSLYEPKGALLAGETGMEFYERFEREALRYLNPTARVFFEIGFDQGKAIAALFSKSPWKKGVVEKDFASHDRFFSLEIE
ncbi:peptide chain release factor N(5)-glutamine methyltransferase [Estrella lausannensis]|uniref:Release factor glutamine methyltransferase n=1 Tax=Estrella lausannensis TaxID=483423 RepID=A0A0H5E7Z2_9BACT|nr:peptide chain release factor N(5)-glutamine methyltransferase [Estrella lausannensis]CRX39460.1 Protein methyltransferase HemK [Estrella lausannensis]